MLSYIAFGSLDFLGVTRFSGFLNLTFAMAHYDVGYCLTVCSRFYHCREIQEEIAH